MMTYISKTPILLIAFNRPDYLEQTFAKVRMVQPAHLYIAVDGPRPDHDGEYEKVRECQSFAKKVDWPCKVHTLFREKNVGCGHGPAEAISWAFETTDRLVILEDDCVAEDSFFRFCDEMLELYANDERVWLISGRGHHPEYPFFKDYDYIFSHYGHTWGWATWKRCWKQYDIMMSDFPKWLSMGGAYNVEGSKMQGKYYNDWFSDIYSRIEEEVTHSWDAQWLYTFWKHGGLAIVPALNQIHNVGAMGTHTTSSNSFLDLPSAFLDFPLRHPDFVLPIRDYEDYHFNKHILPMKPNGGVGLKGVVKRIIKKVLGK